MKTKILVVEDNENNLYVVSFLLTSAGFEVLKARDGVEGIESVKKYRPNLVLMDMKLPKLDGYEATRRLKADPELKSIPVIGLTAYAMSDDEEKVLAAGCEGFITKPIDPDTFLDTLKMYINKET